MQRAVRIGKNGKNGLNGQGAIQAYGSEKIYISLDDLMRMAVVHFIKRQVFFILLLLSIG